MTGFMNNDGSELVGGLLPSGVGQAFQLDILGNLKTTDKLMAAVMAGKAYSFNTPLINCAAGGDYFGCGVLNNSTAKNILLVKLGLNSNSASTNVSTFYVTAMDTGFTTAVTPEPMQRGGAASVATVEYSPGGATITSLPGSHEFRELTMNPDVVYEILQGSCILLPAGAANGLSVYVYNPANNDKFSFWGEYLEF